MAERIRFRFNAAKASVTMAFLALLGGVAAKAGAERPQSDVQAHASKTISWLPKLSLSGLSGNLRTDLQNVQKDLLTVYMKDQKQIGTAVDKVYAKVVSNFYDKHAASATFLTQSEAGKFYLKNTGIAANAAELGGLAPSAFIQGTGGVQTNAVTITGNSSGPQNLLTLNGTTGSIIVVCTPAVGGGVDVTINNGTSSAIPAIMNGSPITLAPGKTTPLTTIAGPEQFTLQTLPAAGLTQVLTLTVSGEQVGNNTEIVGQMLNGDG